ncbi:hypothetical protein BGZ65_008523, partial [Modicella reniformis]
ALLEGGNTSHDTPEFLSNLDVDVTFITDLYNALCELHGYYTGMCMSGNLREKIEEFMVDFLDDVEIEYDDIEKDPDAVYDIELSSNLDWINHKEKVDGFIDEYHKGIINGY